MRRLFTLFFLLSLFCGAVMAQQMSDEQVVQYVKDAQKTGKSQREITVELMRRGVTKEQVERIKEKYENAQEGRQVDGQVSETRSRQRVSNDQESSQLNRGQTAQGFRTAPANSLQQQSGDMPEDSSGVGGRNLYREREEDPTQQIFGHNVFSNPNLTFEPNYNIATPIDYRLGPGDEVIIDVWGASETTIRQTISPEGSILVNTLGPVYLSGKTVDEANQYLKQEFSRIYSGVSGTAPTTDVKLTLGEIRSIQVNVMGEVMVPGTYTLSSFSSVFHALYSAGGVNKIGSLRNIKVVRNGDVVAELDVYDLLMQGKMKDDIRLQDGDAVLVNPYISLVQILGHVKRPMFYELTKEENMKTLLEYAGGFMGDAYKKAVRVVRKTGRELQIYNVDEADYASFRMDDGDVVTVDAVLKRYENRVEIRGAVYRPGLYQMDGSANTVKSLLAKAEGVRGDAFLNRAILDREKPDLTHEMIQVDLRGLLNGTVADIPLVKNDILYIPSIHDIQEEQTVTIHGEVANPGTFLYSENMTVEDLVLQAGGFW